ncbi:hypothetical protein Athai_34690 [Actinocatenispora thailandica]|uniref:Uncharacterized protein n=1 Tax=Actinocatenispora thailandica TaxID=227318 RepID=A0A7R7DQP4_9ACTN|nr:hypothetical protein [Actinocatenispora thailandica]BCJ35966.1 hypothetical protein Athai_34690 [Actinocatenispora thailandica]
MQTIGPYALRDLLGAGPAGRVWRGVDQQGNQVTMAVLEGQAAVDPQSRWQFSATVEQVRQSAPVGGPVAADLVGQQPWVAFPDDGGASAANVFAAMGAPCQPVSAPAAQHQPGQPVSGQPMPGRPVSAQPVSGQPVSGQSVPGQPMSGPPGPTPPVPGQPTPVSGMPASGAPIGSGLPPSTGADEEPATAMIRPDANGSVPPQGAQQPPGPADQLGTGAGQFGADEPAGFGTASAPNPFEPVDPFNAGGQQAAPAPDPFAPQGQQQSGFAGQQPEPFAAQQPEPFAQQATPFAAQQQPQQQDQFGAQPPQQYPPLSAEPEEKPRRTGLLVGLVILIVVVLGGGIGAAVYFTRGSGTPQTKQSASAKPTGGKSTAPQGQPTPRTQKSAPSTPQHPGKEPPKDASWPSSFAKFGSGDKTKPMSGLAGLGFDFVAPADWTCTKKDQSTSYVNYHCVGSKSKASGDVIVRTCGEPCDAAKKIHMREQEEAFGLRWERDGGNSSWAQAENFTPPETSHRVGYGLVLVRYWHSKPGGPMDRQVVLRFTAPAAAKGDVQKVANSVRDATQ